MLSVLLAIGLASYRSYWLSVLLPGMFLEINRGHIGQNFQIIGQLSVKIGLLKDNIGQNRALKDKENRTKYVLLQI